MPDGGNPNANSGKDDKAKRADKKRKAFTRMFEGITDQYLSDYSERDVDLSGEEEADDKVRPAKEAPEPPPQPEAPKSTGLASLMASGQNAAAKPEGNKISSLFESSDNLEKPQLPPEVMQQAPQAPPQQQAPQAPPQSPQAPPSEGHKKKGLYTQLLSKPVLPEDIAAAHPPTAPGAPPPAPAAPPPAPAQSPAGYPAAGRSPGYPSSPSIPMPPMPNAQPAPQSQPAAQPQSAPQDQPPQRQAEPQGYPSSGSTAGYPASGAYPAANPQVEPLMQSPVEPQESVAVKGSLPPAPKLGSPQRGSQPGSQNPVQQSPPQTPVSQNPPPQPQRRPAEPTAKEDVSKWKAGFVEKFKDPPARPSNEKIEIPLPPKDGKMHTAETAPSWGLETQKAVDRLMLSEGEIPYQSAQDRRKKRAKRQEEDFEFQSASGKFAGEFTKVAKKNPKVKALLIAANIFATIATAIILYRCHEPGGSGFAIIGFVVWLVAAVAWLWALSLTFNGYKRLLKRPFMFYLPLAGVISVVAMTDVPTQIAFTLCRSSLEVKAADLQAGGEHRPNLAQSSSLGLVGLFHVIDYGVDHDNSVYFFTDDEPQPRGFIMSTQPPPPAPFGMQVSAHRIGEKWFSF